MYPGPLFTIFGKGVFAYGLCIGVGILVCLLVFFLYTKKIGMPNKVQDFSFVAAIVGIATGFLFAKLYQAFYEYLETGIFDFYNSGMTVMGGLIGGAICFLAAYFGFGALYFKGKEKNMHIEHFSKLINVAPLCILVAHGFGRIGCAFAGCCHGTFVGWEYTFGSIPRSTYNVTTGVTTWHGYFTAIPLYESAFLFATFIVLSILLLKKNNKYIMPLYLICYGVWRIFIEFFRTDSRGAVVLGLQPSQWQSILFIVLGVALIFIIKYWKNIETWFKLKFSKKPKE